MSRKKYLINSIEAAEKHEFDQIVKSYLKEIYGFKRMSITDGKDDVGIDLKVFDYNDQNLQYQLTTQKSSTAREKKLFEEKLYADILKAKKNKDEYGYSNSLFFFYSKKLTNKSIRAYEKYAIQNGINLTLIDCNRLADEAEDYLQLQRTIIETNNLEDILEVDSIFPSNEKNLLFDLIGFGESSNFKLQIVESFILERLFQDKELTFQKITSLCKEKFKSKENDIFYEKLLGRLQTSKKIIKDKDKLVYFLNQKEEERIFKLKEQYEIDEKNFILGIKSILNKYGQETFITEYIFQIKKIYTQNFSADISNLIENLTTPDLSGLSRDFLYFIDRKLGNSYLSKELAISLFNFCHEDKFIQKFAASKVFSEKTNLSKLEKYVNSKKRIYIDTQIALHGLCFYYNSNSSFNNYFYNISKSLIQLARKNKIKLSLLDRYLWEIRNHLQEAFNIVPFTLLPNFYKLGKSRNVFYNFYLHERESTFDLSFLDFLDKFGFKSYDSYKAHNKITQNHLSYLNIEICSTSKTYDIEDISNMIQWELDKENKFKPKFILNNDSIAIEFLSDNDVDIHPLQPVFLSWDKIFFKIQSEYFRRNPNAQRWILLTPGKFIDQYSILQFQIDSEALTSEILALLSDDIIRTTHSLLDSMAIILNPNDEVGLEYTNRIAEIRDKEIHKKSEQEILPPDDLESEAVIDDVFYKLTTYYQSKEESVMENFKKIFTKKELIDKVIKILVNSVDDYYKNKKFDEKIYLEFDSIILNID